MNTKDDNSRDDCRVVFKDNLLDSSYYARERIKKVVLELWTRKIYTFDIESLPQDDLSDCCYIGDTLSPISKPITIPVRRLFGACSMALTTSLAANYTEKYNSVTAL